MPPGENRPYRIEAYDISNTNGVDSVGAMVVYEGMKPVRKDYRRFKIKTVEGPDDYRSLQEVIYRRFRRAEQGDSGFSHLPDFLFMDGGQGQVAAVQKVLAAMKAEIPVVGMAKDEHHRTRALVSGSGREVLLAGRPLLLSISGLYKRRCIALRLNSTAVCAVKKCLHQRLMKYRGLVPLSGMRCLRISAV